jgi:hypothetical protein
MKGYGQMTEQRPVIVEITTKHVVWVYADTPGEALASARQSPFYELVKDGETDVYTSSEVRAPDKWDWDEIYERSYSGGYQGVECDAHVEAHHAELRRQKREAEQAACTAAGHPDTNPPLSDGRRWCMGCRAYLPALASAGV